MNKIIAIVSILAAAFAAEAQSTTTLNGAYNLEVAVSGGTNNVGPGAGVTRSNYLDITKQDNVAVFIKFRTGEAGTVSNALFKFVRAATPDGTTDDTANTTTVTIAGNGTNFVQVYTNISVTGYNYLKLRSMENTNLNALGYLTNVQVGYTVKKLFKD